MLFHILSSRLRLLLSLIFLGGLLLLLLAIFHSRNEWIFWLLLLVGALSVLLSPAGLLLLERQRSARSLQALMQQYLHLSSDPIAVIRSDGTVAHANPAFTNVLGWTVETLPGQSSIAIVHPEDMQDAIQRLAGLSVGQPIHSYECRMQRRFGGYRTLLWSASRVSDTDLIIATAHDITDRKQIEQALQSSQDRLSGIIDSAMDAIITVNDSQQIILFNHTAERMFGYAAESIIGQPLDRLLPERFREAHRQHIRRFRETGDSTRTMGTIGALTLFGLRADDSEFPIEASISQIGRNGDERLLTAIVRDVTLAHQIEKQLVQAQKMEGIGRMAGGIAHDFNNLLTAILGIADLARSDVEDGTQIAKDLDEITHAGRRAAVLTRQMLAFSRVQMIEPYRIRSNDLLIDVAPILKRLIDPARHRLMFLPNPDAPEIIADPNQIEQVLVNLIINARDAIGSDEGDITVETSQVRLDTEAARIRSLAAGDYLLLTVTDTGCGMAPDTIERAFEPFFTTKEHGKGTGLGLAMTYGIIRQHGGHIWITSHQRSESTPISSTRVSIYLPVAEQSVLLALHPEANDQPPAALPSDGMVRGSGAILLVDDERAVRDLTARILSMCGYQVMVAAGGHEALALLREGYGPPDLLITDVIMPQIGGIALARQVKELWPEVPVLFVSGYTDNTITHDGAPHPDVQFLPKPFTPVTLSRKVHALLAAQKVTRVSAERAY